MSLRTQVALAIGTVSFLLGLLADALFQGQGLGVNVFVWTVAFVAALAALLRPARAPLRQGRRFFVAPALVFSALFAWHDSAVLLAANLVALAAAVAVAGLRRPGPALNRTRLGDYVGGLAAAGAATAAGPVPLLSRDVTWPEVSEALRSSRTIAVGRGLALTVPLLLGFGALFVAADAVFKGYVTSAFPNVGNPLPRIGIVIGATWVTLGLLRDLLAPRERLRVLSAAAVARVRRRVSFGAVEIGIVLGVLDLLFLAFVLVQLRYLFGGHGLVAARTDLTYAEYARHGFFELLAVCALTLPLLLLCDALLRREHARHERLFRVGAGVMVGLVLVVVASALARMRLYMDEYGLTELRVYATGAILWLAVVFVWLAATVLRGRRSRFAVGVLLSGLVATLALNLVSPDALIARTNLTRPKVDVGYLAGLSDDAVPTLVERIGTLPPPLRQRLAKSLLVRETGGGWRSWSLARSQASQAIAAHRVELARIAEAAR